MSRNIARVIRNSVRDLSWETAGCATQALSNLPGLAALPSQTAASRSHTSAIEVIAQLTSEECGPELCTVLEQMSLAEMLAFPEHLREAALNAHCPSGCFQLSAEEGPFTTAKIPAVQQYEGSLRLLQGFAPLLSRVGTRSLVLSSCGMDQEHVQVGNEPLLLRPKGVGLCMCVHALHSIFGCCIILLRTQCDLVLVICAAGKCSNMITTICSI